MEGPVLMRQKRDAIICISKSRGRGIRTPVNGFGDRRTATVLFPYVFC